MKQGFASTSSSGVLNIFFAAETIRCLAKGCLVAPVDFPFIGLLYTLHHRENGFLLTPTL
jgi:hypothetical protein